MSMKLILKIMLASRVSEWRQTWGKPRKRNEEESEQVYWQHHMQNTENQYLYSPRICSKNRYLGWQVVTKATEGNLGERWGGTMRKTGCNRRNCLFTKRGNSWSFRFQLSFALRGITSVLLHYQITKHWFEERKHTLFPILLTLLLGTRR